MISWKDTRTILPKKLQSGHCHSLFDNRNPTHAVRLSLGLALHIPGSPMEDVSAGSKPWAPWVATATPPMPFRGALTSRHYHDQSTLSPSILGKLIQTPPSPRPTLNVHISLNVYVCTLHTPWIQGRSTKRAINSLLKKPKLHTCFKLYALN